MWLPLRKDKATQDFLWGFVREQVEEEATAQGIVDKIKKAGDTRNFFVQTHNWDSVNDVTLKNSSLIYYRSCLNSCSGSFFFSLIWLMFENKLPLCYESERN